MARYNLPRVFTETDEKGNPQGFGPGECEVPDWVAQKLKARGRGIESYRVKESVKESAKGSVAVNAANVPQTPEKA